MRFGFAAVAAVAVALSVAACSNPTQNASASGNESTKSSSSVRVDVPLDARPEKVAQPLNSEAFLSDACRSLSSDHAKSLNLTMPGDEENLREIPACLWRTVNEESFIRVSYLTMFTGGLSDMYAEREKNPEHYKYFEPASISGYPAVYADDIADERGNGLCVLNIGVTDNLYVRILAQYYSPQGKNACELASKAGEAVIATMKKER